MISLLLRFFSKKEKAPSENRKRDLYVSVCSFVGIGLNVVLFLGKFVAGTLTASVAIRSDAINNLSDAAASIITLLGVKLSNKKPDPEHPFGHGRIEYLSALFVSVFILVMGIDLLKESFGKILSPEPLDLEFFFLSCAILLFSVLIKFYMFLYDRKYGKAVNSGGMLATSADSLSDMVATFFVLISAIVSKYTGFYWLDGICGVLVSGFIIFAGFKTIKETAEPLLGQAPDKELIERIYKIVLSHPPIIGIHDLVVHDYGPGRIMISLHAEVPSDADILEMHEVIDNAETELREKLLCSATIHCDPVDNSNPETSKLKEDIICIVKQISPTLSIHDFRVVYGKSHTNLIFDLVMPNSLSMSESEICKRIRGEVLKKHPHHFCVIQIDADFTPGFH